jgi:cysteinyl-tRNA synthetase
LEETGERTTADKGLRAAIERCNVAFRAAMDDDFNTPVALAELQRLKSDVNRSLSQGLSTEGRKIARDAFRSLGNNLGLFQLEQWQFGQMPFRSDLATVMPPPGRRSGVREISQTDTPLPVRAHLLADADVQLKVDERNEARKQKNFKKADEIRQSLASHGIVIEDKPDGTSRWKR